LKSYTSQAIYRNINLAIVNGRHANITSYLASIIQTVSKVGAQYAYKDYDRPVYRGCAPRCIDLVDYRKNQIHYWPAFTSTSENKSLAINWSNRGKKENPALIFEIYLSPNNPHTGMKLPNDWSFYPSEQEVLLMPFFCFQVISIDEIDSVTCIKVVEVPHQNFLTIRQISLTQVIWLDGDPNSKENRPYSLKLEDAFKNIGYTTANSVDNCVKQINETVRTVLIVSG